ncbi:hypothetical protein ACRRTK_010524 [Alexandromys fortis]
MFCPFFFSFLLNFDCIQACVSALCANIASFILLPFLHFGDALFSFLGIAADSLGYI